MRTQSITQILCALLCCATLSTVQSCSEEEITSDPLAGLTKVAEGYAVGAAAKVELYAKEALITGYNPVFIRLQDSLSRKAMSSSHVSLYPEMNMHTMKHSCPVENPEEAEGLQGIYNGAVFFTMASGDKGSWTLNVGVHNHATSTAGTATFDIEVNASTPSQMSAFVTPSGERYYITYHFPEKLGVGQNSFDVIVFKNESAAFVAAEDLEIELMAEMPAMDHGSPNNQNPVHSGKGHYTGKVNFTMTGEWRLNLAVSKASSALTTTYFDVLVH